MGRYKKIYTGPIDPNLMSTKARKAYYRLHAQRQRCYNKKNKGYKYYGAKGIRVEYTSREFIGWFITQDLSNFKNPDVGRKDHSKNYCFDNIFIQERSDNIKERNDRNGNPGRTHKKVIATWGSGKQKVFKTKTSAALFFDINVKTVFNHCQRPPKNPFKFGRNLPRKFSGLCFKWA